MRGTMYWVYFHAISSPTFWLLSVLAIAVCLVPDTTITVLTPHILSAIYKTKVWIGKCRTETTEL
uniref:Uncharacterized protein n=1 Tax=Timema douglasi TaxID=61478 RepID=A0A7R8VVM4_TIMDO|nr:unnamed protein product [Timema douglasi]